MASPIPIASSTGPGAARSTLDRVLARTALVAGAFLLVLCAALLLYHFRAKADDPLKSPELTALKEQLLVKRADEGVKERIRALDLELRRRYFHQLTLNRSGSWLALGSALIFLLVSKQVLDYRKRLPMPQPNTEVAEQAAHRVTWSRQAVAGVALMVGLALLALVLSSKTALPRDAAQVDKLLGAGRHSNRTANEFASLEEMQRNWPRFRGPGGNGISIDTNVPVSWNGKTGAGVAWQVNVKAAGFGSPIVWGDRVFISGGDATQRVVLCYQTSRGELLWERPVQNVPGTAAQAPDIPEQTGYAASTVATDGRRVYALFANGDLAAFTLDGKPMWAKNMGVPKNPYGHAASLATHEDRLILQWDQGSAEQNLSKLYALNGVTGAVVWQRNRPVGASWATPIVVPVGSKWQIVTLAVPWAIAYSVQDGAEAWRVEGLSGEVTPSPIFAGGMVLAVSPTEKLMAIRPDGQGDVTKTHVAWSAEDNIPDVTSPVSNGELVFSANTSGVVTCYDLKDGKKLWEQDLNLECQASPALAGNRLYIIGAKGQSVVAEAGRTFKELGRGELDDKFYASPAFGQGRMFLRGVKHLFCISAKEPRAPDHHAEARP